MSLSGQRPQLHQQQTAITFLREAPLILARFKQVGLCEWQQLKIMANPNPSPETRFEKGVSGNPGGKKPGQRKAEIEAAEIAANLRLKALSSLQEMVNGHSEPEDIVDLLVEAGALKLFKDSEDRAHGTPRQSVDHTSSDSSMTPVTGFDIKVVDAFKGDADPSPS